MTNHGDKSAGAKLRILGAKYRKQKTEKEDLERQVEAWKRVARTVARALRNPSEILEENTALFEALEDQDVERAEDEAFFVLRSRCRHLAINLIGEGIWKCPECGLAAPAWKHTAAGWRVTGGKK